MVAPGELVTHQPPGVKSPVPGTLCVQPSSHRPPSDSDVRQFYCSRLCEQARGHDLRLPLLVDRATSPIDGIQQSPTRSKILAGTVQRPGGPAQSPQSGPGAEWSLHPHVARDLLRKWGFPTLDLFATHLNAKLPLYCSLIPDPQALFKDAFRHPWYNLDTYAFPPFQLVERVVARFRETPNLLMTLVAPLWPEKAWLAELLLLLTQLPLALPLWDHLLLQPHFHRFHGGVHALNLHPWRLSSVSSESQAFREELRSNYPAIPESPLHAYASRNGSLSVVGVVEGALLQSTPLYP